MSGQSARLLAPRRLSLSAPVLGTHRLQPPTQRSLLATATATAAAGQR